MLSWILNTCRCNTTAWNKSISPCSLLPQSQPCFICYTRILSTEHTYTWAAVSFNATLIKHMWLRLNIYQPALKQKFPRGKIYDIDFQTLNSLWLPILSPLCLMQQITGSPGISVTIKNYRSIVYSSVHIVLCRLWSQPNHLFIYLIPSIQLCDKLVSVCKWVSAYTQAFHILVTHIRYTTHCCGW